MTQTSSLHSLPAIDAGRPLTMAALADMGLTTDASLLALNDAVLHGADIAWEDGGVAIEPLARLPRASLEALLELRREFAHVRQIQGYAKAKANGVNVGRHVKELPPQFEQQTQLFIAGEISCRKAAVACGMPPSSFMRRARSAQSAHENGKENAVLPPRVADACRRWASRELTKKEAAAEAGISLSMFDRTLAAHGITRVPRERRFAAACAQWEAGAVSKQTAVRESKLSDTEFNALLRKAGKPLHFDGEKPHWLDVLESGAFEPVRQRWADGELTKAEAAAACGLAQRDFDNALQEQGRSLRAGADPRDARAGTGKVSPSPVDVPSGSASGMPEGRRVFYLYEGARTPKDGFLPRTTPDAAYRDNAGSARPQPAACLASLKPGDTLCVLRETHLADDFGQAVELLGRLARRGVHVRLGSAGRLVRSEGSPFLRLSAEAAAAIVKFRQAFTARKAREGFQRRIARGERVGRPLSPLPEGFAEARVAWLGGRMTGRKAAALCGMAYSTFAKRARA